MNDARFSRSVESKIPALSKKRNPSSLLGQSARAKSVYVTYTWIYHARLKLLDICQCLLLRDTLLSKSYTNRGTIRRDVSGISASELPVIFISSASIDGGTRTSSAY